MSYSSTVLADSPLAYYRLDDATTTMLDSSGNARHGTLINGPTLGVASLLVGDSNAAMSFAPAGQDYATAPDDGSLDNLSALSIDCLIKPTTVTATQMIAARDDTTAAGRSFQFYLTAAGKLAFTKIANGVATATSTASLVAGTTYHVAVTYDGTTIRLYINGVADGTAATSGTLGASTTELRVAARRNTTPQTVDYFSGVIDELALYGSALSSTRIGAHYTAATTAGTSGTLAQTFGSFAVDASGTFTAPAGAAGVLDMEFGSFAVDATGDVELPDAPAIALTIPTGTVGSTLTDFVTRVNLTHLASLSPEFWASVSSDGGNLRVRQDGVDVPFDLVDFDTDGSGNLFFKATVTPDDNFFTVEAVPGATALADSDPLGQYEAWSDYALMAVPGVDTTNRVDGSALTVTGVVPLLAPVDRSPFNWSNTIAHDGVAVTTEHRYVIGSKDYITKYDLAWNQVAQMTNGGTIAGFTASTLSGGVVLDGLLYVQASGGTDSSPTVKIVAIDIETFAAVQTWDITATGWAPADIATDGTYFYTTGFARTPGPNVNTTIQRWTLDWQLDGLITMTSSISGKQGIEIHDGYFWICGANDLWRVNLDGTGVQRAFAGGQLGSEAQGLSSDGEHLWVTIQSSAGNKVYRFAPADFDNYPFDIRHYLRKTGLPKLTAWTVGLTSRLYNAVGGSSTKHMVSYGTNDTATSNIAAIQASASANRYQLASSTDGGLSDTTIVPARWDRFRFHMTYNGTIARKIYRDGVLRNTDDGVAQRPGGAGDTLFIAVENTATSAPMYGSLTQVYLRNGELSADWLAAEAVSWEAPEEFYTLEVVAAPSSALDVEFGSFGFSASGDVAFASNLDIAFGSFEVEAFGETDAIAGAVDAVFGSFGMALVGATSGVIGTDRSNAFDGMVMDGSAQVETTVTPTFLPRPDEYDYDATAALPTPTLVNGRPT